MIKIKPLANYPGQIPALADMWLDYIGKDWMPYVTKEEVENTLQTHLNEESLPMAYVAMDGDVAIGVACFRIDDVKNSSLFPWLAGLCVDRTYRGRGIGKILINAVKSKAFKLGFKKLHLAVFDKKISTWYESLGWEKIDTEKIGDHKVDIMAVDIKYSSLY